MHQALEDTPQLGRRQSFGVCSRQLEMAETVMRDTRLAPSVSLPRHRHLEPYLCIVLDGGYVENARQEIVCEPGSIVAHPGGHEHANHTGPAGARCVNVEFSPSLLADSALRSLVGGERQLQLPSSHPALARLRQALALSDNTAALSTMAATLEVVSAALTLPSTGCGARWLRRVVDHIESDLGRTPSLDELAQAAGVHVGHLVRSFKKAHGESVGRYLRRRRLEVAQVRLLRDASSLADIATDAGFCDQAHFTRAYMRHFGITPGQRRRLGRS